MVELSPCWRAELHILSRNSVTSVEIESHFSRKSSIQPYLESVDYSPYPDKLFKLNILFTHQQMHFLLNLEKFKFILKYT